MPEVPGLNGETVKPSSPISYSVLAIPAS